MTVYNPLIHQTATLIVAASDSLYPQRADYQCDGVNDNVEIQAALDALPAGGGSVGLLEGRFNIAAKIELNDNFQVLNGCGWSTNLIAVDNLDDDIIEMQKRWQSVSNLRISGNKANQASGNGISIIRPAPDTQCYSTVHDVYLHEVKEAGIKTASDLNDGRFYAIFCYDCGIGVDLGASGWQMNNFLIVGSDTTGILSSASWTNVDNGRIWGGNATAHGITISEGGGIWHNLDIDNNGGHGILIDPGDGERVEGLILNGLIMGENSRDVADAYNDIHIDPTGTGIAVVISITNSDLNSPNADYSIYLGDTGVGYITIADNTKLTEGVRYAWGINPLYISSSPSAIFATENSGLATITAGNTTVDVTHEIDTTVNQPIISLVCANDMGGAHYWVSDPNATTFRINISAIQGGDVSFRWYALSRMQH